MIPRKVFYVDLFFPEHYDDLREKLVRRAAAKALHIILSVLGEERRIVERIHKYDFDNAYRQSYQHLLNSLGSNGIKIVVSPDRLMNPGRTRYIDGIGISGYGCSIHVPKETSYENVLGLLLHELSHVFGLDHECSDVRCIMYNQRLWEHYPSWSDYAVRRIGNTESPYCLRCLNHLKERYKLLLKSPSDSMLKNSLG